MPKSKLDPVLNKIAEGTLKEKSTSFLNNNSYAESLGDPNCPLCGGKGYLRRDLPLGHPEFGKAEICSCRKEKIAQQRRQSLYSLSNLDELTNLTFDTFLPRGRKGISENQAKSLEWAFNQTHEYSKTLNGWLLLQGRTGCGKTHLAAAVANWAVSIGVPTLFLTVPQMLDTLRSAYSGEGNSFEERFYEIQSTQLLILDDFGTQNSTAWAQEKLFLILNYRYINRLPTIVTTNLSLDEIEERIRSRLQDLTLVKRISINASDYRNPSGDDTLLSAPRLKKCTFENFSLRKNEGLDTNEQESLEEAFKISQAFAENPQGWLIITGEFYNGKTHLAAAIGHRCAEIGVLPLFMDTPTLLDYLRATFSPDSMVSFDRRFNEIRTAPLFILDDFGTQSATPWAREKLFQLFNFRYNMELPTVITIAADSLEGIDPRIRSRMLDYRLCAVAKINVPPYHGGQRVKKKR